MSAPGHDELVERITEYLSLGGFWNPELMDHEKVRELLIDCREALSAPIAAPGAGAVTEARLQEAWTDFLNANPDDLTSPEELPDHALMTGQQFVDYALAAFRPEEAAGQGEEDPWVRVGYLTEKLKQSKAEAAIWKDRAMALRLATPRPAHVAPDMVQQLRCALEAVDSEIQLTGQLKDIVDEALTETPTKPSVHLFASMLAKTTINKRFQKVYDAGMASGKHGHYETMFAAMHQAYTEAITALSSELAEARRETHRRQQEREGKLIREAVKAEKNFWLYDTRLDKDNRAARLTTYGELNNRAEAAEAEVARLTAGLKEIANTPAGGIRAARIARSLIAANNKETPDAQ